MHIIQQLLEALEHDNLVLLKKILDSGDVNLKDEVIVGEEYDLDEPDEVPLLFYAIQYGASRDAIEMLMAYGIDITEVNREGVGALDIAIKYKRMDIIKLCGEQGISFTESRRRSGITPLILAASFNDTDIVSYFIEQGADLSGVDRRGFSAIDYARKMQLKKMLKLLESNK